MFPNINHAPRRTTVATRTAAHARAATPLRRSVGALALAAALGTGPTFVAQPRQSDEPNLDYLVEPLSFTASESSPRATLALSPREFIVARGPNFSGDPPDRRGTPWILGGESVSNPGLYNNAIVAELERLDAGAAPQMQALLAKLEAAYEADPHFLPIVYNSARVYEILSLPRRAAERYERVRALVPDFALNHLRLGRVYERLGEERAALDSYRTALKKDPADLRPLIALGDFYLAREQRPQAERYYETALKLQPEYVDAKIGLGRLLMAKQDWQRARILLESIETVNLDGSEKTDYDRALHYLLALIATELRDYDAAVANYDRLLRHPEDVFFLTHSRRDLERRRAIANDLARTTRGE